MPARLTMLDLAKQGGNDAVVGLIEENLEHCPEAKIVPARTIQGTEYKTLHRTGLPSVGFRNLNQGVTASKSTFKQLRVEAFILGGRVEVDQAYLDASEDGEDYVKALEAAGVMKSSLIKLGNQFYYGDVKTSGFPGLQSFVGDGLLMKADGDDANKGTSVYGVKFGPQDVQFVFGKGDVMSLGEWRRETLVDGDGKKFPGQVADLTGWVGLQCVNPYSVGRIANLTAQAAKGKLTDALIGEWLTKFPVGQRPDVLFMSRFQAFRLQSSRATVNAVGKKTASGEENWPPPPTESNGVRIEVTDSLSEIEAIVT